MRVLEHDERIIQVDLRECSREPIHIPGSIQPHGVLLVLNGPERKIAQVSDNSDLHLGVSPSSMLGGKLEDSLPARDFSELKNALAQANPAAESPVRLILHLDGRDQDFDALMHRLEGGEVVLELEPVARQEPGEVVRFLREVRAAIDQLQAAASEAELFAACAQAVARLTGFERVMVYRFDPQWNGEVVGEQVVAEVDSYLGLHFPASDIPEQARALYARTPLRIIPDASYRPASILPQLNPRTGQPLDLSNAALRSVAPVHLEYLRNMGVQASMSISLMRGTDLWGLVACHHRTARHLPYSVRAACELLGRVMSVQIGVQEERTRLRAQLEARAVQTQFFDVIAEENNFVEALGKYTPRLLEMMHAGGAAIYAEGEWTSLGETPEKAVLVQVLERIQPLAREGIFATDELTALLPGEADLARKGSGVLLVALSTGERNCVLFFRPEFPSTITWAGNPTKAVEEESYRLHPRKSFAAWQQKVVGRSRPWLTEEIAAARELRHAFNASILQQTDRLLRLSKELEAKNSDLNSFAYISAHDLKEPVRGIHHYTGFVLEDYAQNLPEEGRQMLTTVQTLAVKIEELLASLLHFSSIGRLQLSPRPVSLASLLDEVLLMLRPRIEEAKTEIRRPNTLPVVPCDPALVREVFVNLITNAIKYNDKPQKWVEIGSRTEPRTSSSIVLSVRDNGIGIRERHFGDIFTMFRRLHERDKFGGGTGAGLAIVKTIVEKHGGEIWIESTPGKGTTFLFTLPSQIT